MLTVGLVRLRRRRDFLRVAASGRKVVTPGLVLQSAPRPEGSPHNSVRVGFTASRRVGGAVARNRAKRRLRAAAINVLPDHGGPQTDYVLIARAGTCTRPFTALVADLQSAVRRVAQTRSVAAAHD